MSISLSYSLYGAVSFSATTKMGPFYEQIWSGNKTQTMREPRSDKRPHVKPGHAFKMYWKTRLPRSQKPVHYIGLALCSDYRPVSLADVWWDRENAFRDGFISLEEFRNWFVPDWTGWNLGELNLMLRDRRYRIISWEYPLLDWGERPRPLE